MLRNVKASYTQRWNYLAFHSVELLFVENSKSQMLNKRLFKGHWWSILNSWFFSKWCYLLLLWWFQWFAWLRCQTSSGTCRAIFKERLNCRKDAVQSCILGRRWAAPSPPSSLTLLLGKQPSTDFFNDCQLGFTDSAVPKMWQMCCCSQGWKQHGNRSGNFTFFSFSLFFTHTV